MMWLFATAAIVLIAWLLRAGMKPAPNELNEPGAVGQALAYLRDRGVDAGEMRFQLKTDAGRMVVFTKRIIARNNIQLRGTLCDDNISGERY